MTNEFWLRGGFRSRTTFEADGVERQEATDSAAIYNLREAHRVAIRERDQARARLAESEERLRLVAANLGVRPESVSEEVCRRDDESAELEQRLAESEALRERAERERDEARLRVDHE